MLQSRAALLLFGTWLVTAVNSLKDNAPLREDLALVLFDASMATFLGWLVALENKYRNYAWGSVVALLSLAMALGLCLQVYDGDAVVSWPQGFVIAAVLYVALAIVCLRATYLFRRNPERYQTPTGKPPSFGASPLTWFLSAFGLLLVALVWASLISNNIGKA
jgi:hypothetical protein